MSSTPLLDTDVKDMFTQSTHAPKFDAEMFGINENSRHFRDGRWCFDTPGALQPDQVWLDPLDIRCQVLYYKVG